MTNSHIRAPAKVDEWTRVNGRERKTNSQFVLSGVFFLLFHSHYSPLSSSSSPPPLPQFLHIHSCVDSETNIKLKWRLAILYTVTTKRLTLRNASVVVVNVGGGGGRSLCGRVCVCQLHEMEPSTADRVCMKRTNASKICIITVTLKFRLGFGLLDVVYRRFVC